MYLSELFQNTVNIKYDNVGEGVSYKFVHDGETLFIYFQGSHGDADWFHNFWFFKKPYKDMSVPFKVHRGFLCCWKQVEDLVLKEISREDVKKIVISGYSHGAAIAQFCHEFCWFHREDIRDNIEGYGFEGPRIYGGFKVKKELKERWSNFYLIRNHTDIVTHVPPVIFGFCHVVKPTKIGKKKRYSCVRSHYPEKVFESLEESGLKVKILEDK